MSTKEEAALKLKKAGFEVAEDMDILMVKIPLSASMKNAIKDVKEKLSEFDYTASFGIKQYKDSQKFEHKNSPLKEEHRDDNSFEKEDDESTFAEEEMDEKGELQIEEVSQFSLEDFGMGM